MIKFVAAEVVRGVGGDNDLGRRGHATGAMWKNKLCSCLAVNNVASDEIAWPSKSHTGRGVINQPEVLCESRCVLRGCVGVPVVGMPLFSPFLPRVRKIADEPQNIHVDWILGIGLDGQGVPSVNIIREEGEIHGLWRASSAGLQLDGERSRLVAGLPLDHGRT